MKKLLILVTVFLGWGAIAHAAQPVELLGSNPESKYLYTDFSIGLTSFTVSTIPAVGYGYRLVKLTSPTSFWYRLDGSSQNLTTTGYLGVQNTDVFIESIDPIYLELSTTSAQSAARYIQQQK